jgi:hypothetical protein
MFSDFLIKYMPTVPTYSNIFGSKPTLDELVSIIRQVPLFEWQSFLSRMQSILGKDVFTNKDNHLAIFNGCFSGRLKRLIMDFNNKETPSESLYICYERQLSTLQQLAFLHASDEGCGSFDDEKGRDKLGIALLMILDLMDVNIEDSGQDAIIAALIQQQIRMAQTPWWIYFTRAMLFYETDKKDSNNELKNYLSLFRTATDVDPIDHIMGGLLIAGQEIIRSNEQASGWKTVLLSEQIGNPEQKRLLNAFEKIRCATPSEIKESIFDIEGNLSVSDWNLISLSRFPLVKFPQKGAFIINLTSLGRSLFDGIRHTIISAARGGRLPPGFNKIERVNGLYGHIFENYVLRVLEQAFPGQVLKIPEAVFRGKADCLILFPGKVFVVEIKSAHFRVAQHFKLKTIEEYRSDIVGKIIRKGIDQIESTIKSLKEYKLKLPRLPSYDWTITPIIPFIITEEYLPLFPLCWDRLYREFEKPLLTLQNGSCKIGRLRILSLDDIELIPSLTINIDFATLLLQWGNDPEKFEFTFRNYLDSCGYDFPDNFMRENYKRAFRQVATKLGFDPNKFYEE